MNVKGNFCVSAGMVLVAVMAYVIAGSQRASTAPPRSASKVEVPKFVVDPSWPHIPNGWTLGQVSSAATDPDGNIWIIHRYANCKARCKNRAARDGV